MNVLFALLLFFTNWYYIPSESPAVPVEIESINLKLKRNELALSFFSLSNGEATLLQHPNGENILINTGGMETAVEIEKLLNLYNVYNISTIILTNSDLDYVANLGFLLENYQVKQIITSKSIMENVKDQYQDVSYHVWGEGTKHQLLSNLEIEILFDGEQQNEGLDLSIKFMKHRILIMASFSEKSESALLDKKLEDTNIVKIPGFAMVNTMSDLLIKHLDPQIAVVFHATNKKPEADIFERLHNAWIDVYYTRKHGTITMKFTDVNYEVITIQNDEDFK